jgi:YVTN family beta-propeller protein
VFHPGLRESFTRKKESLMKRSLFIVLFSALAALLLISGSALAQGASPHGGKVVVANRNSGSISVIDTATDTVLDTITLPGSNPAEPMYVVYSKFGDRVFVGDRANDQVVVFDADDFSVVGTVPTGSGVFHMWADSRGRQLWVNNDVDNTATTAPGASPG